MNKPAAILRDKLWMDKLLLTRTKEISFNSVLDEGLKIYTKYRDFGVCFLAGIPKVEDLI